MTDPTADSAVFEEALTLEFVKPRGELVLPLVGV
jgi:hypothetical protein